jgi:peptidoglycan-N-acetylglucosamine deacetylase
MPWQHCLVLGMGVTGAASFCLHRGVTHPASKLFGPVFDRGRPGLMQVALTFDDGPDPTWTPRIAAKLNEWNAPATFFCIGQRVKEHPGIVRALVSSSHEIANHSYTHLSLWSRSSDVVRDQLQRSQSTLSQAAGDSPRLFRPPFGDRGPQVLREARNLGLTTVLWSLSSNDWDNSETGQIVNRVLTRVRDGAVLLFHDGSHKERLPDRSATLNAVSLLVPALKQLGFRLVTVSTMIASSRDVAR